MTLEKVKKLFDLITMSSPSLARSSLLPDDSQQGTSLFGSVT